MRRSSWLGVFLLTFALAGCGAAPVRPKQAPVGFPLYNLLSHGRITRLPAALGLLVPKVRGYACSGFYAPANPKKATQAGSQPPPNPMGFWQVQLSCVDPHLRLHVPKGTVRAGMVWVWEQPDTGGEPVAQALHMGSLTDVRTATLGETKVGEGRADFGGYASRVVWMLAGRTTWQGLGKMHTAPILIWFMGRAVPLSVLREFAQDTRPL